MDEVNVQPVDFGDELRQGVEFCLDLAPVILCRPIARERLGRIELHSLGCIRDRFPLGPTGRGDASSQIDKRLFRNVDAGKGRMASPAGAAVNFDGSRLTAPATAMPVAAVPNSRRRSRSIVSEVLMVSMVSLLGLMVCSGALACCPTPIPTRTKSPVRRCYRSLGAANPLSFEQISAPGCLRKRSVARALYGLQEGS